MKKLILLFVLFISVFLNATSTDFSVRDTTITDFPWTWDFAGANYDNWPPEHWQRAEGELLEEGTELVYGAYGWAPDDFLNDEEIGNRCARINIYGTGRLNWLITPSFDLSNKQDVILAFDIALSQYGNGEPGNLGEDDEFTVVVSPDNGVTWSTNNIVEMWTSENDIPNSALHVELPLSGYNSEIKIGFYGESFVTNEDVDLFLDNIEIYSDEVTLPTPNNFVGNVEFNDISFLWESPEESSNTLLNYNLYQEENLVSTIDASENTFLLEDVNPGNYSFGLSAVYEEGESEVITTEIVITDIDSIVEKISFDCYPNPFNSNNLRGDRLSVEFSLPETSNVTAKIYNLKGQLVKNIYKETSANGEVSIHWDGKNSENNSVKSGIYYLNLKVNNKIINKKITVLR